MRIIKVYTPLPVKIVLTGTENCLCTCNVHTAVDTLSVVVGQKLEAASPHRRCTRLFDDCVGGTPQNYRLLYSTRVARVVAALHFAGRTRTLAAPATNVPSSPIRAQDGGFFAAAHIDTTTAHLFTTVAGVFLLIKVLLTNSPAKTLAVSDPCSKLDRSQSAATQGMR